MLGKRSPIVSVIMAVYNDSTYLSDSIDSVLGQTLEDFEFIMVDDGSTDGSADILTRAARDDSRVNVLTNSQNVGLTRSLNRAARQARGVFIARQDADDISLPERFAKQTDLLSNSRSVSLTGTSFFIIDAAGRVVAKECVASRPADVRSILAKKNPFAHGSIMFERSVGEKLGFYRDRFVYAQDYDLYLRWAEANELGSVDDFLYKWRLTEKAISIAQRGTQLEYAAVAKRLASERRETGRDSYQSFAIPEGSKLGAAGSKERHLVDISLLRTYVRANRLKEARGIALRAIRAHPLRAGPYLYLAVSCSSAGVLDFVRRIRTWAGRRV